MKISKLVNRIIYPKRYSSEVFVKYLRDLGAKIGENTYFFAPKKTRVDINRASYLSIGSYCKITEGVQILCHDYSWSVLRKSHHEILPDPGKKVEIGDNVFIGVNTLIMGSVKIGSNVIIGANSVVTHDIPDNSVYAGSPARHISTLDDFYKKKKERLLEDAFYRARFIYDSTGNVPTKEMMSWFGVVFLERNEENEKFLRTLPFLGDNINEVIQDFYNTKPLFKSFEEFLESALKE